MSGKRPFLTVIGLGLLASQAGHLLAYQVRFGAAAVQVQSTGLHSYFPTLARTSLGLAAGVVLTALLLVALARVLTGREVPGRSRPSYIRLLAALFTIQVAAAPLLLLWGTLGQLPVAALAALALRWLATRVEAAVGSINEIVRSVRPRPAPALLTVPVYATPHRALLTSRVAATSVARRGPPSLLIRAH